MQNLKAPHVSSSYLVSKSTQLLVTLKQLSAQSEEFWFDTIIYGPQSKKDSKKVKKMFLWDGW